MAIFHVCDGCGEKIEKPVPAGTVLKRDYCAPCAEKAEEFLRLENELRVDLVGKFNVKRLKLIQKCSKDDFILPDVVYDRPGSDQP